MTHIKPQSASVSSVYIITWLQWSSSSPVFTDQLLLSLWLHNSGAQKCGVKLNFQLLLTEMVS